MADYFTNFILILPLPDKAAQTYALDLAVKAGRIQQEDESTEHFPAPLIEAIELWHFETDPRDETGIWLHSENGGIDAVCAFLQHLLQRFDPTGRVTFEWSNDCSQPRVDAYGGGAAIVTATEIKTMSTGEWLQQNAA